MLIRLCGHFVNNPGHIDKLISIKGLPEEWLFRPSRAGGKELMPPWEPDVEANIPKEIRHLCEPVEITRVFPPIEKGRDAVIDKVTIIGIKFNYMSTPGQELWEKIERYLDRMTPRDEKVPVPIIVAPDHKSGFSPHVARRSARGSLELAATDTIPEVDLRIIPTVTETINTTPPAVITQTIPQPVVPAKEPEPAFPCDKCPKTFFKKQALSMHKMKMHSAKKEIVGV